MVTCNGASRAAEPPAILDFYVDGLLVCCVEGAAPLGDVPSA